MSSQHTTRSDTAQIIPPEAVHADLRGTITALPHFDTAGTMVIESEAGSVRGNHYHLNESHLMYVVSGRMIYLEEDDDRGISVADVGPGESVISPKGVPHATVFPEHTVFVTLSDWDRRGHRYEDEIVRVDPLEERPEVAPYLEGIGELLTGEFQKRRNG
ncbi:cupin domain-containing protein [Streptomyces sp. HC44]|uniref:Cupin domain-containing protein n=1 Tax=Streptomyces scabichelini TaxID=2711217 RepID=A0A6G4UZ60_9ACTN|nr:cupin domain-containing protein [Streptomyces scabichelini]NGO06894.1 cupin domain-containing protein [Streptomyces scabichelini]